MSSAESSYGNAVDVVAVRPDTLDRIVATVNSSVQVDAIEEAPHDTVTNCDIPMVDRPDRPDTDRVGRSPAWATIQSEVVQVQPHGACVDRDGGPGSHRRL